jgi:transposase-like protein
LQRPLEFAQDILIACVDGLKGFPEAIEAIFPKTTVQTCIVHLIRNSLKYVPRREREQVARDLKPIYTALDADHAHAELERFDEKWGARFPVITQAWLDAWEYEASAVSGGHAGSGGQSPPRLSMASAIRASGVWNP